MSRRDDRPMTTHRLTAGQELVYGGDRVTVVSAELAEAFTEGDRLVIVQETGDLLHVPGSEHELVSAAVDAMPSMRSRALGGVQRRSDHHVLRMLRRQHRRRLRVRCSARRQSRPTSSRRLARGRSTTRLRLTAAMRSDMAAGLRSWACVADPSRPADCPPSITRHGRCRRGALRWASSASCSRVDPTCSPTPPVCCAPATPPCSGSAATHWAPPGRS